MKKFYLAALLPLFGYADVAQNNSQMSTTPFIEYHNRMVVFDPFHQAYERIRPDAFYVGVEAWLTPTLNNSDDALIGEAELRMGYNFFCNGRDRLTPVIGGGVFKDFRKYHGHHRLAAIGYGMVGLLYDHEFNAVFTLGTTIKAIVGGSSSSKQEKWGSTVGGFDAALPLTFRFGRKRHWDVRIEPFDIYLHGSERTRNYVGFRNTVAYRF